jgi:adenosine deaminase
MTTHANSAAAMRRLPKVELHLHLDCSLSFDAVSSLDPSISAAEFEAEFVAPTPCSSLADFLKRAPRGFQLMQTADALRLATEDVFQQLAADNVVYAELRFAPLLHLERGLAAEQVVAAVERATDACIRTVGIEARLILCTLRHFTAEQSLQTAKLVERFRGSRVVALDIAGDEAAFAIEAHVPAFRYAIERGLPRTAHAGEAAGANSVWQTLQEFQPSRIGHGVRSVEDPELVAHLKTHGTHLELCPSSNVQTGAWPRYADHPIEQLRRDGVSVGISTDARTITNVNLNLEYARIHEHFGWRDEEFTTCNRAAMDAAFAESSVKQRIIERLSSSAASASEFG